MTPAERLDKQFNKMRKQLDFLCQGMQTILARLPELKDQSDDCNNQCETRNDNGND